MGLDGLETRADLSRFILDELTRRPGSVDVATIKGLSDKVSDYTDFGFVTALPTTAKTGDTCTYVNSLTAPTYRWHLAYLASEAGSYKWQVVGGTPVFAEVLTSETTASAAYAALATAGPSVTVPLAGDYDVEIGCRAQHNAAQSMHMSYDIGGTGAVDNDSLESYASVANVGNSYARTRRQAGLAASAALVSKYKTSGATATFSRRFMRVMPVRVI